MTSEQPHILCVDDDPDNLFLIRDSINRISDVAIETARNGQQAFDFLMEQKKSKNFPSIIIPDISMPIMDGIKMLKIDVDLKEIQVVIFTTSAVKKNKEDKQVNTPKK